VSYPIEYRDVVSIHDAAEMIERQDRAKYIYP
jgi:hypothetical protein